MRPVTELDNQGTGASTSNPSSALSVASSNNTFQGSPTSSSDLPTFPPPVKRGSNWSAVSDDATGSDYRPHHSPTHSVSHSDLLSTHSHSHSHHLTNHAQSSVDLTTPSSSSTHSNRKSTSNSAVAFAAARKKAKICRKCDLPISGQFVRALSSMFHIECFTCADCGQQCSSKFFPIDNPDATGQDENEMKQIPLCEHCYFKRLDLLCYSCKSALRGSYITALDRKYHVEHFTCSLCDRVFGPEDSYYEHNKQIYCHYHYSTLYASKCEGCQTSILKQFVEIYRNGREQQWHPECYMIFKFWNVKLDQQGSSPENIEDHERKVEQKMFRIWNVLCGYEEASAAYISDMLQSASAGRSSDSLKATASLVAKIEVLFTALHALNILLDNKTQSDGSQSPDDDSPFSKLTKEPKSLCKKVVEFMSLVSKARERSSSKRMGITQELLNLVTSLAHYLKVLIRFGLSNCLHYDRLYNATSLDSFLSQIETHQRSESVLRHLGVSPTTSDHCLVCDKTVEDMCVRYNDKLWHVSCLNCSQCSRPLINDLDATGWNSALKRVECSTCSAECKSVCKYGFNYVPKLLQFVFLLRIAIARLQLVLSAFDARDKKVASKSSPSRLSPVTDSKSQSSPPQPQLPGSPPRKADQEYMGTLSSIRRLRSAKLDKHLTDTSKVARQSIILNVPLSEQAQVTDVSKQSMDTKRSSKSSETLTKRDSSPKTKELKIEDMVPKKIITRLGRTTDLLKNEKSLTLDDIPRIVAAEQAREQRPNAFRHQVRAASITSTVPVPKSITTQEQAKKYLSELTPIQHYYVRHIAVMLIQPIVSEWFTLSELVEIADVTRKQASIWNRFRALGGGGGNSSKKRIGVFGTPVEQLVEKYGVDSTLGVGPKPLRIPAFVDDCISAMKQKDMSVEGVFRKNGNIRKLKEFTEKVERNPDASSMLSDENPVQLAALLRKFLRELPEPLMTYKLLRLWLSAQKVEQSDQRTNLLHYTCCLLPRIQRDTLEVLFYFLNWTASFSHIDEETGSKMDSHNLATVITPNILYVKESQSATSSPTTTGQSEFGDVYFLSIEAVDTLIQDQNLFAEVPADIIGIMEQAKLLDETNELPSKDVFARVESALKSWSPKQ